MTNKNITSNNYFIFVNSILFSKIIKNIIARYNLFKLILYIIYLFLTRILFLKIIIYYFKINYNFHNKLSKVCNM